MLLYLFVKWVLQEYLGMNRIGNYSKSIRVATIIVAIMIFGFLSYNNDFVCTVNQAFFCLLPFRNTDDILPGKLFHVPVVLHDLWSVLMQIQSDWFEVFDTSGCPQ